MDLIPLQHLELIYSSTSTNCSTHHSTSTSNTSASTSNTNCVTVNKEGLDTISITDYDILHSHIVIYGRYINPKCRLFGLSTVQVVQLHHTDTNTDTGTGTNTESESVSNKVVVIDCHSSVANCLMGYYNSDKSDNSGSIDNTVNSAMNSATDSDNTINSTINCYEIFDITPSLNATHDPEGIQMTISSPLCQCK